MVDLWVMVGCWFYMEKRGCWVCAAFCLASCAYCGLSSMPVALRLSLIAVVMVVPEPAKGSSVVPGLVVVLQLHVGMKPVVVMILTIFPYLLGVLMNIGSSYSFFI